MTGLRPESHALLDAARGGDEPTNADRERVRAALTTRLTVAAAAGAGLGAASSTKSSVVAGMPGGLATTKLVIAALIGAVGVVGTIGAMRARAPMGGQTPSRPASSATAASLPSAPVPIDPLLLRLEVPPDPGGRALPVTTSGEPSAGAHPGTPATPVPAAPTSDVAAEVRLIGEAHKAIRGGDAERALLLLEEHARRFPKGALGEERDAARIAALCALGRTAEARDATDRFLRALPLSPHAGPLRASCGGPAAAHGP